MRSTSFHPGPGRRICKVMKKAPSAGLKVFCLAKPRVLFQSFVVSNDLKTTHLPSATRAYSLVTMALPTTESALGIMPQPMGPKASFSLRRYLISGR